MSDCLRPEEPQGAVWVHELHESAVSGNLCHQASVPVGQDMPPACTSNLPDQATEDRPAEIGQIAEVGAAKGQLDQATEDRGS